MKSGVPLGQVAPKQNTEFFTPSLETYFIGVDRILRKQEKTRCQTAKDYKGADDKFFIT